MHRFILYESRLLIGAQSLLLVAASALCILLAPPPLEFQRALVCADVHFVGRRANIVRNCDADDFLRLARDPSGVLAAGSKRQSRPGYGILGWMFSLPFRAIDKAFGGTTTDPYYAGYVALNAVLMTLVVYLLADLTGVSSLLLPAAVVPVSVLLVNQITKAFFWTPHQQIFSLVAAMISIWLARRFLLSGRLPQSATIAAIGAGSGLACLVYGVFILVPATLTVTFWLFLRHQAKARTLLLTSILWTCSLIPVAGWRAYVVAVTGRYYSFETRYYHEFVWIVERLREGPSAFFMALWQNLLLFVRTIPEGLGLPLAFIGIAFALAMARRKSAPALDDSPAASKAAAAFLVAAVPFYALMGFYAPRLTAVFVVPLVVILGVWSKPAFSKSTAAPHPILPEPIVLAAIGYIGIVILIRGPYA